MRDNDGIDLLWIDPSRSHVCREEANRWSKSSAHPSIDQNELWPRVDDHRVERVDEQALRHIRGLKGGEYLVLADVLHVAIRQWYPECSIRDLCDFEVTDLVPIESGCLLADRGCGCTGGRSRCERGCGNSSRASKQGSTSQAGHSIAPRVVDSLTRPLRG